MEKGGKRKRRKGGQRGRSVVCVVALSIDYKSLVSHGAIFFFGLFGL